MTEKSFDIKTCPTCGSSEIKRVRGDWKGRANGRTYMVPDLEYYECPNCGEKVYPPQAMRRIEANSPVFRQRRKKRA